MKKEGELHVISHAVVSHYSTTEFVKCRDNSHLRPYAAAITHKDSHAARLMLLRAPLPLHACVCVTMHVFACRRVRVC